jgi:hypothetical protein
MRAGRPNQLEIVHEIRFSADGFCLSGYGDVPDLTLSDFMIHISDMEGNMSDGPHRSLQMRKGWKKLAERGDGRLHTPEQVCEAVPLALGDDWREERCDDFMREAKRVLIGTGQNVLFEPSKDDTLEALKRLRGSGHPFRRVLLDSIVQAVEDGHTGEGALVKGTTDALAIRSGPGLRQVEEHYLRRSSERRAAHVRTRIEDGTSRVDFNAIARQFCKLDTPSAPKKFDGLDEGVSIR